jgi:muconolactone delta-isomerase
MRSDDSGSTYSHVGDLHQDYLLPELPGQFCVQLDRTQLVWHGDLHRPAVAIRFVRSGIGWTPASGPARTSDRVLHFLTQNTVFIHSAYGRQNYQSKKSALFRQGQHRAHAAHRWRAATRPATLAELSNFEADTSGALQLLTTRKPCIYAGSRVGRAGSSPAGGTCFRGFRNAAERTDVLSAQRRR